MERVLVRTKAVPADKENTICYFFIVNTVTGDVIYRELSNGSSDEYNALDLITNDERDSVLNIQRVAVIDGKLYWNSDHNMWKISDGTPKSKGHWHRMTGPMLSL